MCLCRVFVLVLCIVVVIVYVCVVRLCCVFCVSSTKRLLSANACRRILACSSTQIQRIAALIATPLGAKIIIKSFFLLGFNMCTRVLYRTRSSRV